MYWNCGPKCPGLAGLGGVCGSVYGFMLMFSNNGVG